MTSHRVPTLLRALLAAGLCLATVSQAHADSGDQSLLDLHRALVPEGQETLTDQIASLADRLAVVTDGQGLTLLPPGTLCEKVDLEGGRLRVFLRLPNRLTPDVLSVFDVETTHQIFRHRFAEEAHLTEIRVLARKGEGEGWRPLDAWATEPPPVESTDEHAFEIGGPGPQPGPDYSAGSQPTPLSVAGQGPLGTSGSPFGALAGRTVFISGGHGWTWNGASWGLQRPLLLSMNEDHGNVDQLQFTARHLFNAGATVVPMRPVDHQPNEVVVDDSDVGVTLNPPGVLPNGSDSNTGWVQSANENFYSGGTPYIFTQATPTETRTATFTPNIPEAGFYPVFCWANYGSDRISGQLYRINHTGGSTEIRVNHRRVGRGWVWLGTYHFEAGSHPSSGSVVISNHAPPSGTTTGVVIADAIRFGNGLGDVDRGGGVSGRERETEASRYWVQRMVGDATSSGVYDISGLSDSSDNVGAPARMAAEMRRDDGQGYNGDIYLGYHSNASSGAARGCVGLITTSGSGTPLNQATYATLVADEQDRDCLTEDANWENVWIDRSSATFTSSFGEISNGNLGGEMCGTIIEVAFHDNALDAELLRDPKVRDVMGRAHCQAIVQYFNQFDGGPLVYRPETPVRVRAINIGGGDVRLSWAPGPAGQPGGDAATGYRVYTSPNGLGFELHSSTAATSATITGLTPGETELFQVTATNAGGESFPSEVLAARVTTSAPAPILLVNGYDRLDRLNNPEQFPNNPEDDETERVRPSHSNSYRYMIPLASALAAAGADFNSSTNEAIESGDVLLTDHDTVLWILGEESTDDETFSLTEQTRVAAFLAGGGNLFLSGAEIAWDLDNRGSATDQAFINGQLHADYVGDDSATHSVTAAAGSIFAGNTADPFSFDDGDPFSFDDGTGGQYDTDFPDRLSPVGTGAEVAMTYVGGTADTAAIQYDGTGTTPGKVVILGFSFETITSAAARDEIMDDVLNFFTTAVPVELSGLLVR
jgi:N-acetylmuramoyl-L-alanine amidase